MMEMSHDPKALLNIIVFEAYQVQCRTGASFLFLV